MYQCLARSDNWRIIWNMISNSLGMIRWQTSLHFIHFFGDIVTFDTISSKIFLVQRFYCSLSLSLGKSSLINVFWELWNEELKNGPFTWVNRLEMQSFDLRVLSEVLYHILWPTLVFPGLVIERKDGKISLFSVFVFSNPVIDFSVKWLKYSCIGTAVYLFHIAPMSKNTSIWFWCFSQ